MVYLREKRETEIEMFVRKNSKLDHERGKLLILLTVLGDIHK